MWYHIYLAPVLLRCARRLRVNWAHNLFIWGNERLSGPLNLVLNGKSRPQAPPRPKGEGLSQS